MEQYFQAAKIPDAERVSITGMCLAGCAKLWWGACVQEVTSGGIPTIDEWVVLKKELRAQFLPCNVA